MQRECLSVSQLVELGLLQLGYSHSGRACLQPMGPTPSETKASVTCPEFCGDLVGKWSSNGKSPKVPCNVFMAPL